MEERALSKNWDDVFVVAGPTAGGKSALAVDLAEKWNAKIVSADACQVYRGLAILTAQPTADQRARVPHHLVGYLPVETEFSAADFAREAERVIAEIRQRGRRILVVGGAGFYLEALFDGLAEAPAPDPVLRSDLAALSLAAMVEKLTALDPAATATVDLKNPRRVQRAIEIVATTGRPFADFRPVSNPNIRGIVLAPPREILLQRIGHRVSAMLASGAIEEVRRLGPCSQTCGKTIGLSEIRALLDGKISLAECRERMTIATRQYAKRQMTWFRNRARWPLVESGDTDPKMAQIFTD